MFSLDLTENEEALNIPMIAQTTKLSTDESEVHRMKDFRFPNLSIIHEGGSEPNSPATPLGNIDISGLNAMLIFTNHGKDMNDNVKIPKNVSNDLARLKATASRLNLRTRRSSYMIWRDKYLGSNSQIAAPIFGHNSVNAAINTKEQWTQERMERIDNALEWLRNELQEMRFQDQDLARQLLSIRHEIYQLKLQRSCEEHKQMLDNITHDLQEARELDGICDVPLPDSVNECPLRQIGITRMNLCARRFSTC
ncbi:hypothetical protein CHS0354_004909 [Potamilus streckersoni]|uniref:Uncharacterized protein n=1 Tax=Potamilus streckersoni TaxID=2493646 RepID=A0AAE0WFM9_9BIVA|nr:hypothetical protein CHS0354_004909 [Potamilus streckersoni]